MDWLSFWTGFFLGAGIVCGISAYVIHRLSRVFDEPDEDIIDFDMGEDIPTYDMWGDVELFGRG